MFEKRRNPEIPEQKSSPSPARASFPLGRLLIARGAHESLNTEDVQQALQRHARGDWGDVSTDDRNENELSLREGFRLLSVYHDRKGTRFWIITEADRSVTTVLLPDEY